MKLETNKKFVIVCPIWIIKQTKIYNYVRFFFQSTVGDSSGSGGESSSSGRETGAAGKSGEKEE